jgi:hypothetical protein
MPDQPKGKPETPQDSKRKGKPQVFDAIRHVGPTLEAEGTFLPTGELPENRIEREQLVDAADVRAITEDEYDREADAMGAEPLLTRLPGDTTSDPDTDSVPDNSTTLDTDRKSRRRRVA